MGLARAIGFGAQAQPSLNGLKSGPVDDGLVGALHPIPLFLWGIDNDLGLVAHLFPAALDHHPSVHLVGKDAPYCHLVPQAKVVLHGVITGPASLRLVAGGVRYPLLVEQIGDVLPPMALQRPLENLANHLGGLRVGYDVVFVCRVFLVAVDGETADILALPPLQVEHHADVFGQVLQVPLVHQAIDLPGFFVALYLGVGIVRHGDEAYAPDGEQTVDILLHQFHVPGEPGLGFAQDDLELFLTGGLDHAVEVRAVAVHSGEVLIAENRVNIPAVFDGVVGQQGFLVLDALGLRLMLVFILLTQSCIDRAKDLLHLLKGVTAHCYDTARAVGAQEFI